MDLLKGPTRKLEDVFLPPYREAILNIVQFICTQWRFKALRKYFSRLIGKELAVKAS